MREKMPLYTATQSLNVKYKFKSGEKENASIVLGANYNHAHLKTACDGLFELRKQSYTSSVEKINFVTAGVTFLYADTSSEEGYLGEKIQKKLFLLNIPDKQNRILSSIDFYTQPYKQDKVCLNKSSRCTVFNHHLSKRVEAFSLISENFHIPPKPKAISDAVSLQNAISEPMFHETFHHSEQAIMHYLSSIIGIKALVKAALSLKAEYLYGVVLDLYSERMVCCNCNICLLGMQNSYDDDGFLFNLNNALKEKRIEPRINEKTMLNTRVSVSKPNKGNTLDALKLVDDNKVVHTYDANHDNQVFQALDSKLGLTKVKKENKISLSSYTGGFFVSSQFSKSKLEDKITVPISLITEQCTF